MCSSPFRDLASSFADKYVVVTGLGNMLELAHDYGYKKVITTAELASLVPEISVISRLERPEREQDELRR